MPEHLAPAPAGVVAVIDPIPNTIGDMTTTAWQDVSVVPRLKVHYRCLSES
jgi:hypothetical protein